MIKHCARCGKEFEAKFPQNARIYCSEQCYKAVAREKNRERNKLYREAKRKIKPTERKYCKRYGCLYHPRKGAANNCDYTVVTGKLRGCPSGEGCTCYKRGTAQERKQIQIENAKNQFWGW